MPIITKKETWGIRKTFICTKEDMYMPEKAEGCRPIIHPDAELVDSGDDWDQYRCPHCGKEFAKYYGA